MREEVLGVLLDQLRKEPPESARIDIDDTERKIELALASMSGLASLGSIELSRSFCDAAFSKPLAQNWGYVFAWLQYFASLVNADIVGDQQSNITTLSSVLRLPFDCDHDIMTEILSGHDIRGSLQTIWSAKSMVLYLYTAREGTVERRSSAASRVGSAEAIAEKAFGDLRFLLSLPATTEPAPMQRVKV